MNNNKIQSSGERAKQPGNRKSNVPLLQRRALLKGAAGSLPMVLTLQSGAALARSSNLISSTAEGGEVDSITGATRCLENAGFDQVAGKYDLGDPIGRLNLQMITERDYYYKPLRDGPPVDTSERDMCLNGGIYKARGEPGGNEFEIKPGILVSATAISSFASNVDYDYI